MTAYTHRAKRAHYGVNDKVEKKDFQKDKNSNDKGGGKGGGKGCDKDKGKDTDLKDKICWLCGQDNWRSDEFCTQCATNCFVPVCLGTLILVILYDFLILYLIRIKEFTVQQMTSYPLLLRSAVRTTPRQVKTVTSPSLH